MRSTTDNDSSLSSLQIHRINIYILNLLPHKNSFDRDDNDKVQKAIHTIYLQYSSSSVNSHLGTVKILHTLYHQLHSLLLRQNRQSMQIRGIMNCLLCPLVAVSSSSWPGPAASPPAPAVYTMHLCRMAIADSLK